MERDEMPFVAVATMFPDTAFDEPPPQTDLDGKVFGRQDLDFLREALVALADRMFERARPLCSTRFLEALHDLFGPEWTPRLSLGSRAGERARELVRLDAEQLKVVNAVASSRRLFVTGGPGSGKTLLARDVAKRFTASGARTIYLCFTKALAATLRHGGTNARTVADLAQEILARAGVTLFDGAPPSTWSAERWASASERAAAELGGAPLFDAVVVDEAQDLTNADWSFERALAGSGKFWVFADPGQGYWRERRVPEGLFEAEWTLERRYRCPEELAVFADRYRRDAPDTPPPSAVKDLHVEVVASESERRAAVAKCAASALEEGVVRSEIAVLSLLGLGRTKLCSGDDIEGIAVVRADAEPISEEIVADTFLRFKGLERQVVIVSELGDASEDHDLRMHIALTRATAACFVVATVSEIANDGRLASLVAGPSNSSAPRDPKAKTSAR